jgi:hypothetical protein
MLKSLFKNKADDELLPPPPPFPSMEIEDGQLKEQTKISDDPFIDLFSDLEKKPLKKGKKLSSKKQKKNEQFAEIMPEPIGDELKDIDDGLLEELFKDAPKIKSKGSKKSKGKKGKKSSDKKLLDALGIDEIEPETIQSEIEFPDILEDIEAENKSARKKQQIAPETEQEIAAAILQAKSGEKKGLISLLIEKLNISGAKKEDALDLKALESKSDTEKIQGILDGARNALMDFNLSRARAYYIEAMKVYNAMSPEDQAKVYGEIKDLYFERKSAEQLKV